MNAIIAFLAWAFSLFGSPVSSQPLEDHGKSGVSSHTNQLGPDGAHFMNGNPRTVVALEDTHFRPM